MASLGILPEAWAPFAEGRNGLFSNAVLAGIAAKHNASIAQIVLAMILKMGAVVVSKSVNPERMRENIRAAEVLLDQTDMRPGNHQMVPQPSHRTLKEKDALFLN